MLAIKIQINLITIHTFTAVNVSANYKSGMQTYVITHLGSRSTWKIRHKYDQGAVVLSEKILKSALKQMPSLISAPTESLASDDS